MCSPAFLLWFEFSHGANMLEAPVTRGYKVDIFYRLKTAIDLKKGLNRHKRALSIIRDKERGGFDKYTEHEKFITELYLKITWCVHVKKAMSDNNLPNSLIVRNSSVFCEDCGKKLISENWMTKEKNLYIPVRSQMMSELVNSYCNNNLESCMKS